MPASPHQRAFTLHAAAKVWQLAARTFAGPPHHALTAAGTRSTLSPAAAARAACGLIETLTRQHIPGFLECVHKHASRQLYRAVAAIAAHALADPATRAALTELSEENSMLTIYSTPTCGFCHRLKTGLQREGIAYTDINIEEDPAAASYVESINDGNQVVPTVVCPNGTVMTNPTVAEVKQCLTLASKP